MTRVVAKLIELAEIFCGSTIECTFFFASEMGEFGPGFRIHLADGLLVEYVQSQQAAGR